MNNSEQKPHYCKTYVSNINKNRKWGKPDSNGVVKHVQ